MNCVKEFATKSNDFQILLKLHSYELSQHSVPYHKECKANYRSKLTTANKPNTQTQWHVNRNLYKTALKELCCFLEEYVIAKKKCCYLSMAIDLFSSTLAELFGDVSKQGMFCTKHIPEKLKKIYKNKIKIVLGSKNHKIIASCGIIVVDIDGDELQNNDLLSGCFDSEESYYKYKSEEIR